MSTVANKNQWVYVVVLDPNQNPQYLGQQEADSGTAFIPFFLEKEDALMCLNLMARDKDKPCEVQAVLFGDLSEHAAKAGFSLYLLSNTGSIVEKISPPK
jgi:hypothetical protein